MRERSMTFGERLALGFALMGASEGPPAAKKQHTRRKRKRNLNSLLSVEPDWCDWTRYRGCGIAPVAQREEESKISAA
jgi:hypothetical protein